MFGQKAGQEVVEPPPKRAAVSIQLDALTSRAGSNSKDNNSLTFLESLVYSVRIIKKL